MATRAPARKKSSKNSQEEGRNFFRKLAENGPWAPIYVITGSESFLIREAVERLTRAVFPDTPDDFNFSAFDAVEHSANAVVSASEMLPMFKNKRVVQLRNLDAWKKSDIDTLADYAENPLDTTLLIIQATTLDLRLTGIKKLLGAPGTAEISFDELDVNDTVQWVGRRANQRYRMRMSLEVAGQIVEYVGTSLATLDRALERLSLFLGDPPEGQTAEVLPETVDEIVADSRVRSVFEMTDALTNKDLARSVRIFRRMQLHGESPQGALSLIARQFRGMLVAQELARGNVDRGKAAAMIGCPPFAVDKYVQQARRFQRDELLAILQSITRADHLLKSSRLDDELHVERLMLQICR